MNIVIASTFTADPLATAIGFWTSILSIPASIVVSPYNQIFQQLLKPDGVLRADDASVNMIFVRIEDWIAYDYATSRSCGDADYFIDGIKLSVATGDKQCIILFCPCSPKFVADPERRQTVTYFETLVTSSLSEETRVSIIGSERLRREFREGVCFDEESEKLGGIPYSDEFMAFLGTAAMRTLAELQCKPHKVIVLDCDNTLWKGICGEDGTEGLQIEPGHKFLQHFMTEQHFIGRLLCLCSKNNPIDVDEVFRTHPDMVLQQHHILASRIGWLPKSHSIQSLAAELGLDLDSFIFMDDDAAECAQMRASCPEVLTLQIPNDSERIPSFLRNIWAFDVINITAEDRNRHTYYQSELKRSEIRASALSLDQFMSELSLETLIRFAIPGLSSRISQLTKRTNQFNLNGMRYSESEILGLMTTSICLAIDAKDRFGDYGTIGAATCISKPHEFCLTGLWISCRAMGRGIEHRVVKHIIDLASVDGYSSLRILYADTGRNVPVRIFLDEIGAREIPNLSERLLVFADFSDHRNRRVSEHGHAPHEPAAKRTPYRAPWQTVERIATEWSNPKNVAAAIRDYKRRSQSGRI